MSYDLNRCPQNEEEFIEYFYTLIGRARETPANDWYQVLLKRYEWQGQLISIPRGVGPGIKQAADAPFFGLTQQMGSAGNPQARVVLPTQQADGLGYFTRQIQYIKDLPGGVHGTDFLWTWDYKDGHGYVPVTGAGSAPPPVVTPPPTGAVCNCDAKFVALFARIEQLEKESSALFTALASTNNRFEKLWFKGVTKGRGTLVGSHYHEIDEQKVYVKE
jgi:hypothetical protein